MKLNKALGQHFLTDEFICNKIVDYVLNQQANFLLEIGPGGGALTKYFVNKPIIENFKAIEIDLEKIIYLTKTYPQLENKIIHQDILKAQLPFESPFSVFGNFPYNISSQILFKMIEWKENVKSVIGMFQKEVAERIVASPNCKSYGILSVLIQTFFETSILFYIEPSSFTPPPKVRSGMVLLSPKSNPFLIEDFNLYSKIVKTVFQQRRKQLRNTLKPFFNRDILLENIFYQKRPENLNIEDFYKIYLEVRNNKNVN